MGHNIDSVIVVNEQDEQLRTMEKLAAHKEGVLHRAFSVFVLNDKKELLIQQRAHHKYHSGGLWSNTCCSHPMPNEDTEAAAHRRLMEEMGFDCTLRPIFTLRYKADVGNSLIENEYDHIFLGTYQSNVKPNPAEVQAQRYIALKDLQIWMQQEPALFTPWLHLALPKFMQAVAESNNY